MNKNQLIEETAIKANLSSKDCKRCVNAITELISEVLKRGDKVYISGFGKFETKTVEEREFYNPRTNKKEISCQKIIPVFKSCKKFKNDMFS